MRCQTRTPPTFRQRTCGLAVVAFLFLLPPRPAAAGCVGDCGGDCKVTVDELLTLVNIGLGNTPVTTCEAGDANHDGEITVDEILTAVNNALDRCLCADPTTSSASELRELAAAIYDAVETDGDVASYVEGVFLALDVKVFTEPTAELDDRLAQGHPVLFEPQMHEIADAFLDGGYVPLDSLLAAAAERGVAGPGGTPLDRAAFDVGFAALAGKQEFTRTEALPAFVLTLAAERAARYGGDDPLWGDGQLDPLQTTLLMYAFSYGDPARVSSPLVGAPGPRYSLPRGAKTIIDFTRDRLQGQLEGKVVSWIEIPTDADDDAAKAILCASLQLYGHKMKVTAAPDLVYHQQADGPATPFATTITAVLTFEDDWWDNRLPIDQWLFNKLPECKLQRRGTVPDKPLEWSVSDGLAGHGTYNFAASVTNDDGTGLGYWSTVVETTPIRRRVFANQRDAVGSLIVRAGSLVPGWSTVERAVGFLKDTGNHGQAPLTVIFYVDPCAGGRRLGPDVCADIWYGSAESTYTVPGGGYKITGEGLTWTPVLSDAGGTIYELTAGTVTYEWRQDGCTTSVDPPSVTYDGTSPIAESQLNIKWGDDPVTFSGNAAAVWIATVSIDCPGDDPLSYQTGVGNLFFRAEPTVLTGDVLADNYNFMGAWHFVYSFHR
jgi:hypothetical protein